MYNRILVPLDGSELAESALGHAEVIAKGCHSSTVVLLRIVETGAIDNRPGAHSWGGVVSAPQMTDLRLRLEKEATEYLNKLADMLNSKGILTTVCVIPGEPAGVILDYSLKNQIDLIIMSTHGRSGMSRWAFGSVAEKVTSTSKVPVLVVSPAARA